MKPKPAQPQPVQPPPVPVAEAPPESGLVERVRSVTPVVQRVIGKVKGVGIASALAAVVLWAVLFWQTAWPLSDQSPVAFFFLVLLLLPALGTFVAVLTLREVLDLPNRIKALPDTLRSTVGDLSGEATAVTSSASGSKGKRALGFFGLLWKLRGIVEDTRGSWLRTIALARFAKLASLPFFLWLLGAFALNFVVIAAAALAVLLAVIF